MSRVKQQQLIITFLSFAITLLSTLIVIKIVLRVNPSIAEGSSFFSLFVDESPEEHRVYSPLYVYPSSAEWMSPSWFEHVDTESGDLALLADLDAQPVNQDGPKIKSRAAFVYDLDSGEVLYAKNPDERWPVASLTKLISSLAISSYHVDLNQEVCLDQTVYPNFNGARTHFSKGSCTTGWDLLGSALVRSDNGGAFALPLVANVHPQGFVDRMNSVAQDLNMRNSSFRDPAGVHDENMSTARDITKAVIAVSQHADLSIPAAAPYWQTTLKNDEKHRRLLTTNRMSGDQSIVFSAAKTGYTSTAHHCFTAVLEKDGRRLAVTTLGSYYSRHRWRDVNKLVNWSLFQQSKGKALVTR